MKHNTELATVAVNLVITNLCLRAEHLLQWPLHAAIFSPITELPASHQATVTRAKWRSERQPGWIPSDACPSIRPSPSVQLCVWSLHPSTHILVLAASKDLVICTAWQPRTPSNLYRSSHFIWPPSPPPPQPPSPPPPGHQAYRCQPAVGSVGLDVQREERSSSSSRDVDADSCVNTRSRPTGWWQNQVASILRLHGCYSCCGWCSCYRYRRWPFQFWVETGRRGRDGTDRRVSEYTISAENNCLPELAAVRTAYSVVAWGGSIYDRQITRPGGETAHIRQVTWWQARPPTLCRSRDECLRHVTNKRRSYLKQWSSSYACVRTQLHAHNCVYAIKCTQLSVSNCKCT